MWNKNEPENQLVKFTNLTFFNFLLLKMEEFDVLQDKSKPEGPGFVGIKFCQEWLADIIYFDA